jgi:hypothetical protein
MKITVKKFLMKGCDMDENEQMEILIDNILGVMPDKMSDEGLVCIILNLVAVYSRYGNWPQIQNDVSVNILDVVSENRDVKIAVQDADNFLEKIRNDV